MSFEEQERALFDLLFDRDLRWNFIRSPATALGGYALEDSERADFAAIRTDALEIDAHMRADLILSQLCRAFPLSFGIASSIAGAFDGIRGLVDTHLMRTPPLERTGAFGMRLRNLLAQQHYATNEEQPAVLAIAGAEVAMANTGAGLREAVLSGKGPAPAAGARNDWLDQPLSLAPFVHAGLIPRPYEEMKSILCPSAGAGLWEQLSRRPLAAARRSRLLDKAQPRLLIARATATHASRCDVAIEHRTVELSEGFAALVGQLDGKATLRSVLKQFAAAGAPGALLKSVEAGFLQLLQQGMLAVGRDA